MKDFGLGVWIGGVGRPLARFGGRVLILEIGLLGGRAGG